VDRTSLASESLVNCTAFGTANAIRRLCGCGVVLIGLFGASATAGGYELTGRSWPQTLPGAPVLLTYSYRNLLDGGLLNASDAVIDPRDILTAVEEAFSVWAAVAPLHFTEVPDEGNASLNFASYPPGQYGDIRLGYGILDGHLNFKAQASFPPALGQSVCPICGDVHFDMEERWETIGTLDLPDILGAAIHEIGHSLGLAHTDVAAANMFPVFRRHTGPGSGWLHPDDIAGIQAIYGAGIGSVTPLARVPEPGSLSLVVALMLTAMPLFGLACR
jgi:hypothetical protein